MFFFKILIKRPTSFTAALLCASTHQRNDVTSVLARPLNLGWAHLHSSSNLLYNPTVFIQPVVQQVSTVLLYIWHSTFVNFHVIHIHKLQKGPGHNVKVPSSDDLIRIS